MKNYPVAVGSNRLQCIAPAAENCVAPDSRREVDELGRISCGAKLKGDEEAYVYSDRQRQGRLTNSCLA